MKIATKRDYKMVTSGAIKQPQSKLLQCIGSCWPFDLFGKKKQKVVSILRLDGAIGKGSPSKSGLTLDGLNELIEKAFEPKNLKAVCLAISSPGGMPVQAELIAARIMQLSVEKKVPVYSFVEDVAASGGYWLACAGEEIYASESSIIGSIGVIYTGFGLHKVMEKLGLERRIYTQGTKKSILDPFLPEKADDVKLIKKLQNQIYDHFVSYVKGRRKDKLTQSDSILFTGEFWAGKTALDYGLIDGIDNLYNFINKKFGPNIQVQHIKPKAPWYKKYLSINLGEGIISELKEHLTYNDKLWF